MNRREFLATTAFAGLNYSIANNALAQGKRWRVGVIGHTGHGDYGHGLHTMWLGVPETQIVGIADPDSKGLEAARTKVGEVPGFADFRKMLADTKPEIVAVCPRHLDQHFEMVLGAIEAGARGVYVEKPFCRTPAEADAIVSACEKKNVKLAVAHRNRWHPALAVAKKAIEDEAIGQVLELRGRGKEDTRGGALDLWVLGSHIFNLMHYFAGKPRACSAVILKGNEPIGPTDVQQGAEGVGPIAGDRLHARYEMENGGIAYFESIRSAGVAAANFGLQVIGNKGLIDFRIDVEPLAHFAPGNPFQPTTEPRPWIPISSAGIGKPEPITDLKTLVANHILPARDLSAAIEQNRPTLCSAEDGRVTIEMITAVFASHVRDGVRVAIPLASREHPFSSWTR